MPAPVIRVLLAAVCVLTCFPTFAREVASTDEEHVAQKVLLHAAWVADAAKCPTEMGIREVPSRGDEAKDCPAGIDACLARCEAGSGLACYWLGQTLIERHAAEDAYETLFQRSCKLGVSSGCTNHAAGMFHAKVGDPATLKCVAATFSKTCAVDDPWGCTMFGLLLTKGAGVEANPELAHRVLKKACRLDAQDKACAAALRIEEQSAPAASNNSPAAE